MLCIPTLIVRAKYLLNVTCVYMSAYDITNIANFIFLLNQKIIKKM